MFLLLFIVLANAYDVAIFNDFTADVDIYDLGTMGRGKNAASWHRSTEAKQEIFYYLAMQPWRHLEWKDCTGSTCYKFFINEDASVIPDGSKKLPQNSTNDYCRKEYSHPLGTFDVDWTLLSPDTRLDSLDINGVTCFKYPAKAPLAWIYLQEHYTEAKLVTAVTPCRYDFIGGKSITFRSFNKFSEVFITNDHPNGYLKNKTKCNIDPSENNVQTDLAIVLGISDANAKQAINEALVKLNPLKTVQQKNIYYMSGESIKKEDVGDWQNLGLKQISAGAVDAVINVAKNDLIERVKSKEIYRGTMIVLLDRALATTFDAETAFDRNNITVHTVVFNPKGDMAISRKAASLLSVGYHHHEFKSSTEAEAVATQLFLGVRANLTERCSRMTCNGFCDGRDRCTCPMCCENTCYFSYCKTDSATCMPWPEAKPKPKEICSNDCVGDKTCIDLQGCVYTRYNDDCEPKAKCMKPYCDEDDKTCLQKNSCANDTKPSYANMCWNYECDTVTGNCKRLDHGNVCPKLDNLCMEHVCEGLTCKQQKKDCVKTSLYADMKCYKAVCNPKTGMCENQLNCKDNLGAYSSCGKGTDEALCVCNSASGFTCECKSTTTGYCSVDQICDSVTNPDDPECKKSACGQDLYIDGCEVKTCNEDTGVIEWVDYDCKKNVQITYVKTNVKNANTEALCKDKYEVICDNSDPAKSKCQLQLKGGEDEYAACGKCILEEVSSDPVKHKSSYKVTYEEACSKRQPLCMDGTKSSKYDTYFGEENNAVCQNLAKPGEEDNYKCVYSTPSDVFDYCAGCYDLECNEAVGYRDYTFDPNTGSCTYRQLKPKPKCSYCNDKNDGYVLTCDEVEFEKTYSLKDDLGQTKDFTYTIPKQCTNNQCIPVRNYDCSSANTQMEPIYEQIEKCAAEGTIKSTYVQSPYFDMELYKNGQPQTDYFMATAEESYYCTFEWIPKDCSRCEFSKDSTQALINFTSIDECEEIKNNYQPEEHRDFVTVECVDNECKIKFEVNTDCDHKECNIYQPDQTRCQNDPNAPDDCCYATGLNTCKVHEDDHKARLEKYKEVYDYPKEIETVCTHSAKCQDDQSTCLPHTDSEPCEAAYNRYVSGKQDFGCRKPNVDCDFDTLHCTFTEITKPEEDARYYTNRDEVVFDNLCYKYYCEEKIVDGKLEHHWRLTEESLIEQNKQPESVCEIAACNPLTGKSETKVRDCLVSEHFKQISEAQAECFYCQCSYLNGEMVLVMMPEGKGKTYELDACGNCIVRDQKTGQQINDPVECVLDAPVNLTGAIAGATVAASVVFGLIGSMVVVSIGAFQTYQLVSSAMKNVISTTLENPEFVAADNEATNVLNNE